MIEVGSLFSGIGGIELGLERTGGFRTRWFVENDPYAASVLRKHWPNTPVHGDITKLDFKGLPRVNALTGGFPCQDISNAGKRVGIEGERSGLWAYFREAIGALRPGIALIENVSALTHRGLDIVLADLASLGYDAEWHCFPASAVGAPHQRDRVFIIAYPDMADTEKGGLSVRKTKEAIQFDAHCGSDQAGGLWDKRSVWAVEPDVGRVAHGVPDRVDRIKCLGNAVVPQVAEAIGRAIMQSMETMQKSGGVRE